MSDVARLARELMAKARLDRDVRATLNGVCRERGCANLAELAGEDPELIAGLHEMFTEMDADAAAMDEWASTWNPLQQGPV